VFIGDSSCHLHSYVAQLQRYFIYPIEKSGAAWLALFGGGSDVSVVVTVTVRLVAPNLVLFSMVSLETIPFQSCQ